VFAKKEELCRGCLWDVCFHTTCFFELDIKILEPELSEYLIVYSFSDWHRQADEKYFQVEAERVLNDSQSW